MPGRPVFAKATPRQARLHQGFRLHSSFAEQDAVAGLVRTKTASLREAFVAYRTYGFSQATVGREKDLLGEIRNTSLVFFLSACRSVDPAIGAQTSGRSYWGVSPPAP